MISIPDFVVSVTSSLLIIFSINSFLMGCSDLLMRTMYPFLSCFLPCGMVENFYIINSLQVKSMIHTKDRNTASLFHPWEHLGPKRRKLMAQSWAALFKEEIFGELPVHKIAPFGTKSLIKFKISFWCSK